MERLDDGGGGEELGSLAQAARSKELKTARTTLIAVGVITLLANGVMALLAKGMVDKAFEAEIRNMQQPGMVLDQDQLNQLKQQAVTSTQLICFGFAAVGLVFIGLGVFVNKAPVVCTAIGLVLYIAGWAITAVLDPTMIAKGIILKIIIIVALVKALQAAIAYQRETASAGLEPV
jgi:hypothetical protein